MPERAENAMFALEADVGRCRRTAMLRREETWSNERKSSRFPVVGTGARASERGSQGASVCGSVTVPGVASAARRACSRYALGSTPHSFADSIRL